MNTSTSTSSAMDEETSHYLHLYTNASYTYISSVLSESDSDSGKPVILSSLHDLDQYLDLEQQAENVTITRQAGTNVDTVTTPEGTFLHCHLATLLDFTHHGHPYKHAYEAAAAIALAAHHLNQGLGWIVPELTLSGLSCPIKFSTEFVDTQLDRGVALQHVIDLTDRTRQQPCAFIGATRSTVSIPTALVTGLRGYPQVSAQSTSEQLDDPDQFPLFGRTVPSDVDNAVPIVQFFRHKLQATHLILLHVNNGYGNALVEDLQLAAQVHTPDLILHEFQLSEQADSHLIQQVLQQIHATKFSLIFAALNDDQVDTVLEEAYRQGLAGNGIHNWFFSNTMGDLEGRKFVQNSPLQLAYQGVGRLQVSGGHNDMRSFDTFACNLRTLRSSRPDLDYLASLLPNHTSEERMPFLYEETFLDPVPKMADRTSPAYEAAIALGLAACDVVANGLPLSGEHHFDFFRRQSFQGVVSPVTFHPETGTREANTTLFAVENEVPEEVVSLVDENGTLTRMVAFHTTITDIYSQGEWEHLTDYVFNDGTSTLPPDLTPPAAVDHQYIHTELKVVAGLMYLVIMGSAIYCIVWTKKSQHTRVVKASQPLFLHIIVAGVIIFASAIVPLNIDDRITSIQGCALACNFFYWLMFLGFSVMFSALFTKIYRVNMILNNSVKFKRVKVTIQDVSKPMAAIIGVNLIVLIAMTAVAPAQWEIVVQDTDEHGRPTETYGHCTTKQQIPFYVTLGAINFAALLFSLRQAYNTRKLATEFSESRYIFYAMIGILVALFQGIPVLVLVRDSPDVQDFIKCTVIFVTSCSVLLFLFVPKMKYLKKQLKKSKSMILRERIKISGLSGDDAAYASTGGTGDVTDRPAEAIRQSSISGLSVGLSTSGNSSEETGGRFTIKTHAELADENKKLRARLNLENYSLGTLASTSTLSNETGNSGSTGMVIFSRKSPTALMQENKEMKKILKKKYREKVASSSQVIDEEEKEPESEYSEFDKPRSSRRVSFLDDVADQMNLDTVASSSNAQTTAVLQMPEEDGCDDVADVLQMLGVVDEETYPEVAEMGSGEEEAISPSSLVQDVEAQISAEPTGVMPPESHNDDEEASSLSSRAKDEAGPSSTETTGAMTTESSNDSDQLYC